MLIIDERGGRVVPRGADGTPTAHTAEAFEVVSANRRCRSRDVKHSDSFAWTGRPVLQRPDDIARIRQQIGCLAPNVGMATGVTTPDRGVRATS